MTREDCNDWSRAMYHNGGGHCGVTCSYEDALAHVSKPTWEQTRRADVRPRWTVLTNGVFGGQGLTPGQAWSLSALGPMAWPGSWYDASRQWDWLCIVALASDRVAKELKPYPVPSWEERALAVCAGLRSGFVFEWDDLRVTRAIRELRPDYWVKGGGDWTLDSLDPEEKAAAEEVGAEIVIVPEMPLPHVNELRAGES